MDTIDPVRFIFASFFVLGLLGLLAIGLKYYGQKTLGNKLFSMNPAAGRVVILEKIYIDQKSKLILIKRDQVEHLLLISDGKTTIIESGIKQDV